MKTAAGYSKTPLAKKLGYKSGFHIRLVNEPPYYFDLFEHLPEDLRFSDDDKGKKDLIHCFSKNGTELETSLPHLRNQLKEDGMLWISWPKKSSEVASDLDGNAVRSLSLRHGLVDIKVCAIDNTWSGLKFVIPLKERSK